MFRHFFSHSSTPSARFALVIGNSTYTHVTPLPNPRNDAEALNATLGSLGFVVDECVDCTGETFRNSVERFSAKVIQGRATEIAFYYSGHGLQVDGINYLVPIDADVVLKEDIETLVPFSFVVDRLSVDGAVNTFFLDACRNDPFDRSPPRVAAALRSRGISGANVSQPAHIATTGAGLAPVQAGSDTLIGFSAEPGATASDGAGRHSPYTQAMLQHVPTWGLDLQQLMSRVGKTTRELSARSGPRPQIPWISTNLRSIVYFKPATLAPVFILSLMGFALGLATAPFVFRGECYTGSWGIGVLFGLVLGFGLWRWSDASYWVATLVALATAGIWMAAGGFLEYVGLAGPNHDCQAVPDYKVEVLAPLTGLLALSGTLAVAAAASPAFRTAQAWLGTLLVTAVGLPAIYFATVQLIEHLNLGDVTATLVRYLAVALWYAALGAAIGFVLYRYVPYARDAK